MFKHDFQGGPYLEVFSAQGKDPVANWKLTGASGIKKLYEKEAKSYVYTLEGSVSSTKMQLPKDLKQQLNLVQRYLILQIFIAKGADCSLDFGLVDMGNNKRRLLLSTSYKEIQAHPLHVQIPLGVVRRAKWLNLCFDLASIVSQTWRGQSYKALESICVSAHCKLRRIFTMKGRPQDTTDDDELYDIVEGTNSGVDLEAIPRQCQLASDTCPETQIITMNKMRHFEWKSKGGDAASKPSTGLDIDLNSSGGKKSSDNYQIAFGTKVPVKAPGSGTRRGKDGSTTSRVSARSKGRPDSGDQESSQRGYTGIRQDRLDSSGNSKASEEEHKRERKNSDPGRNQEDPEITVDKESLRTSHTWTDGADNKEQIPFVRPHPPREPSSDGKRRRRPRVKSAGKDKNPSIVISTDDQSSGPNSRSNSNTNIQEAARGPLRVADDDEVASILQAVQHGQQSESESESGQHTNPADDSLDDVINALKGRAKLHNDDDDNDSKDYEDSDDEDVDSKVYMFSSRPISAPRDHRLSPNITAQNSGKPRGHRNKGRKYHSRSKGQDRIDRYTGAHNGRIASDDLSSEEEERTLSLPSHRHKRNTESQGSKNKTSDVKASVRSHSKDVKPMSLNEQKPVSNNVSVIGALPTLEHLGNSAGHQTKCSVSRKALREIPKDDVRLSQTKQQQYDFTKYQMADLTDSFETQMLQQLKEEAMGDEEQEVRPGEHPVKQHEFQVDSATDSSDDTSMSTLKGPPPVLPAHHYQDEMKLAPSALSHDYLTQSNPRDWGNVFSPPIVLPSDIQRTNPADLSPNAMLNQKDLLRGPGSSNATETSEDSLDLLYVPSLNCYYDPRTCRYYELI